MCRLCVCAAAVPVQSAASVAAEMAQATNSKPQQTPSAAIPADSASFTAAGGTAGHNLSSAAAMPAAPVASTAEAAEPAADVELAAFQAEISAIEETQQAEADDRAESPDAEEKRFEDDDGTVYVWSSTLRKFILKRTGTLPMLQQLLLKQPQQQQHKQRNLQAVLQLLSRSILRQTWCMRQKWLKHLPTSLQTRCAFVILIVVSW